MLETSARLLKLLSLLTSRRFWSGDELAGRLGVTARTLRRDIDKLRLLGYPVASTSGVAGGYQLGAGAELPPLLLDEEEATAVAVGLRSAATSALAGAAEAAARALGKLERVLPPRIQRKVEALGAAVAPLHLAAPSVDAHVLATLASACRDTECVHFLYEARDGSQTDRRVDPHGLVSSGARWYLAAWDRDREDFRTFRLDRISRVVPAAKRFARRALPAGSVTAYVSRSVSVGPYEAKVRVIIHAPYAVVSQRVSPLTATLEPLDETRCVLETGGRSLEALGFYIALLGFDFEAVDPPELRAALVRSAQRLRRAADPRQSATESSSS